MQSQILMAFGDSCFHYFLQLHTADIGGQGTTSEVVQTIMRIIQSGGQLTTEL